jgi:hypothetical protein
MGEKARIDLAAFDLRGADARATATFSAAAPATA